MLLSNNKPNFLAINYNLIQNSKSISNFQIIYSKIQTEYNPIIKNTYKLHNPTQTYLSFYQNPSPYNYTILSKFTL